MKDIFEKIVENTKNERKNNPILPEDYRDKDGLLVCGKCHTNREKRFQLNPESPILTGFIMCECRSAAYDKRESEDRQREELLRIRELKRQSLMDVRLHEATFEHFKTTSENERNLKLCERFAYNFDEMLEKAQGLLFFGPVGTGKTFAAACIANYLLDKKLTVVMTSFIKLIDTMQSFHTDEGDFIRKLNRAKLLILDDFGTERGTDFALEKVFHIVDSRYRSELPTIFTTNRSLNEMKQEMNPRLVPIYDRIFEMCYPMQFTGSSWRKQEASNRALEMKKFMEENL